MFSASSSRPCIILAAAAAVYFAAGLNQAASAQAAPASSQAARAAPLVPAAQPPLPAPQAHLMWNCVDGRISFWHVGDDGSLTSKEYGPFAGWTAKALADGPDGVTNILWTRTADGKVSLWRMDGAGALTSAEYGPYPGWAATALGRSAPGAGGLAGAAGGDLFGVYPNPLVAAGAIDHTKLAADAASLGQVSAGLLSGADGFHVNVLHDLVVKGNVVALQGNGGGAGNNGGVGRALVDGGSADNLIINFGNDFGRVSVQSELDVHGALGLEPGDIYANNDINIHKNTTVRGVFGVTGNINCNGTVAVAGAISSGDAMIAKSLQITGGSDLAEPYRIAPAGDTPPRPGLVVSIDPDRTGQMRVCARPYDHAVGGIISGAGGVQPGVVLRQAGSVADGALPIASVGRVWCWCDAGAGTDGGGAIAPGDLLTTSATPGHAMRAADPGRARGAVLGKAMSPLKSGRGLVLVLVTLE